MNDGEITVECKGRRGGGGGGGGGCFVITAGMEGQNMKGSASAQPKCHHPRACFRNPPVMNAFCTSKAATLGNDCHICCMQISMSSLVS